MNNKYKKVLSYIIPIALGLGLLNWVFSGIDLQKTLIEFKNANYFLVFIAGILALFSHIMRAIRWNTMLKPMGYRPSTYHTTLAILIGYLTNLVFPRAGELARAVSLQKTDGIPVDKSFGSVIAERLIDVMVLLLLLLLNLFFEYDRILLLSNEFLPELKISWVVPTVLIFLVGLIFMLIKFKFFSLPIFSKFTPIIIGIKEGFISVFNLEKPGLFILQSFVIWVLYYFSSMLLCYSIPTGSGLSAIAVLTILVVGAVGMAIPTIGGIGSYHLLVGKIVTLYGLNYQDGVSLATFLHSLNAIVFVLIFGIVALVLSSFVKSR